jgi:ubiquinone/menaquinone biosynthesis C-methylase UbiE
MYVCPITKSTLEFTDIGLKRNDGKIYPYLSSDGSSIPDFVDDSNLIQDQYSSSDAAEIYRNFLNWLFLSFNEDENAFRQKLISRLKAKAGDKVLVTACGLGEDLQIIATIIGSEGVLCAQDLSKEMVLQAQKNFSKNCDILTPNFSVGDAMKLPFVDGYFDAVFHFGGINLFDNMKNAIQEMARVTKYGGRVVFGDESVAPWLRNTEYAKIAICNNKLWEYQTPLEHLPFNCMDVNCSWLLGNSFYLIDFTVSESGPYMNIDVPHKGRRGGTVRTRYYGLLEGVTIETKEKVIALAQKENISVHEWLENILGNAVIKRG